MAKRTDRDIGKGYSTMQMVAKLRRLADCLDGIFPVIAPYLLCKKGR